MHKTKKMVWYFRFDSKKFIFVKYKKAPINKIKPKNKSYFTNQKAKKTAKKAGRNNFLGKEKAVNHKRILASKPKIKVFSSTSLEPFNIFEPKNQKSGNQIIVVKMFPSNRIRNHIAICCQKRIPIKLIAKEIRKSLGLLLLM